MKAGLLDITAVLLEHGADPLAYSYGWQGTPMHTAAAAGHSTVLELLLQHCKQHSSNWAKRQRIELNSLLLWPANQTETASKLVPCWHPKVVRVLLEAGAEDLWESDSKYSALEHAIIADDMQVVKLLVEAAHPQLVGSSGSCYGFNAVYLAAATCRPAILKFLLDAGANSRDLYTPTKARSALVAAIRAYKPPGAPSAPAETASSEGKRNHAAATCVRMLLDCQYAPVNLLDKRSGCGALHLAAQSGWVEAVQVLLQHGASVTLSDSQGDLPLHPAATAGHSSVVELLLDANADVNALNLAGNTALHRAAKAGQTAAVQLLLQRGADHSLNTFQGYTALHLAAMAGAAGAVTALLNAGASPLVADDYGQTPLFLTATAFGSRPQAHHTGAVHYAETLEAFLVGIRTGLPAAALIEAAMAATAVVLDSAESDYKDCHAAQFKIIQKLLRAALDRDRDAAQAALTAELGERAAVMLGAHVDAW